MRFTQILLLSAALLATTMPAFGTTVRMRTPLGDVDIRLMDAEAPATVANFLAYVMSGAYVDSFIHRSVPGFIIQGGGFGWNNAVSSPYAIHANAPVVNEFSPSRSNLRGTIAMAKLGSDPNSATNQWFFNLADNAANLDNQNGGFTVFGQVIGNGMQVVDAIAALPIVNAGSPYDNLPLITIPSSGVITAQNLVIISSVTMLPSITSPLADFNGDGKADILWRNSATGDNAIWQMNGIALAASALITNVPAASPGWTIAGVGDFNGDGKSDILWRNMGTGDNAIWLMNGFTPTSSALIPTVSIAAWTIAGVGDFDGDGKTDILWRNTTTGDNAIWLMNGVSVTGTALIAQVPDSNWAISGVGDFDGDRKSDILWHNTNTGDTAVWLMNGSTLKTSALVQSVPAAWAIAGIGDYDGDGKADILWRNGTTGENAIWLMNGVMRASGALVSGVPDANWKIVGAGDHDSDGKADILWRNTSSGQNAIWLMDGFTLKSSALIPTVSDTSWGVITH